MMFEGVPQFWRQHESLDALREEGYEPAEEEPDLLWPALRRVLPKLTFERWTGIIDNLDAGLLDLLAEALDKNKADAIAVIGRAEYARIRGWLAADRALRSPLTRIDEPLHVATLQALHKGRDPLAPPLSDRELGRKLRRDGKTIRRWLDSMAAAGPPPEDGLFDWLYKIVKPPRKGRRAPP